MPRARSTIQHINRSRQVDFSGLQPLEPRQLMTAYTPVDAADAFNLDQLARTVVAPADPVAGGNFGYNVVGLGDINGDGRPDFAVAAPGTLPDPIGHWGGPNFDQGPAGRVFIYSGADLSLIRTLTDDVIGFGASMVAMGDIDGDGIADLAIGSPNYSISEGHQDTPRAGHVTLYSGATGGRLRSFFGQSRDAELGFSLANVGDFDGDGFDDVIVGAPGGGVSPENPGVGAGHALVYSFVDAAVLRTFVGEVAGDRFGHAVAGGVDYRINTGEGVPGDGVTDFIVGAPGYDGSGPDSGRAYVFSGLTGGLLGDTPLGDGTPTAEIGFPQDINPEPGDRFGSSVAFFNINGTVANILVGAPGADRRLPFDTDAVVDRGAVYQFDIREELGETDFTLANTYEGSSTAPEGDRLGERIFVAGQLEQAGVNEIMVLAPGAGDQFRLQIYWSGAALNRSGVTLSSLSDHHSVAYVGDIDGDGVGDLISGVGDSAGPSQVEVTPVTIAQTPIVIAVSDDGSYAVLSSPAATGPEGGTRNYVLHDGRIIPYDAVGLAGLEVRAINNAGFVYAEEMDGFTRVGQFFVVNGVRKALSEVIESLQGTPATSELYFVSMSNTSDVLFQANNGGYLFRDGVLRYLWDGRVAHINDSGVIVGVVGPMVFPADSSPASVTSDAPIRILTPTGQIIDVAGMFSNGFGRFINNQGDVVGYNRSGDLLSINVGPDGSAADLSDAPTVLGRFNPAGVGGTFEKFIVSDMSEGEGQLKVAAIAISGRDSARGRERFSSGWFYEDGAGLRTVRAMGNYDGFDRIISGNLLVYSTFAGRFLAAPDNLATSPVASGENSPINVTWTDRGLDVATTTAGGQAVVLRFTGQQSGLWISAALASETDPLEVLLYTDPRDGRSYAIARFADSLVWFSQSFEGVYDEGQVLPTVKPITSNLVTFTSVDQRVHVVGLAADGDVMMLFQFNSDDFAPNDLGNWGSVNLSAEHLAPQGQPTPDFVSDLTAYVTPWNGLNIAGIDSAGLVHTVWWAPGLTLWQTSNLSAIASAPMLSGNITSYVTSWSGLNVAGTTTDGKVATLWWVPQFGGEWRFDVLVPETPNGLREGTLSAYVTPWGGLNIAGIDPETNKLAVYWWTPTTPWTYENVTVGDGAPTIEGRVTAIATPPGQLDIFARSASNELLRFYWNPGDAGVWSVEDVGARVL